MSKWSGILAVAVVACMSLAGCVIYLNPLCTDQIRNGDETGIDCGGSCGRCDLGERCRVDADCDEASCAGGICTPFPCDNGVPDGQETDVDCGGNAGGDGRVCRKCSGGRRCTADTDCFSGTCVSETSTCSSLATVSFAGAVTYPAGDKTYAMFSGDLNGDGNVDLVAANEIGESISVFLNDGMGVFPSPAPSFPLGIGHFPTGGTLADLDHDGILDVVTANFHGNSISVLLGMGMMGVGTGALGASTDYPTDVDRAETSNLAVGDLNKDGNLDVIATNQSAASLSQFMGRGDGTFAPAITVPVGISGAAMPFSAAIGDFNGDGNDDVAIADNQSGTAIVRLGNGDGSLRPEGPYRLSGAPSFVLITCDVDLDGKLDLVSANRGSNDISVLLGRGDGTFRTALVAPTAMPASDPSTRPGRGPYSIAVADFNLDGVPDVITANFMSGDATVLLGIGNGRFEDPISAGPTAPISYGVAVGDFGSDPGGDLGGKPDGKPDFATANVTSNNITVKLNTSQ